jgi:hypothetical protein
MDKNRELQTRFYHFPLVDTSDLISRTSLTKQDDGQMHSVRIVAAIQDHDTTTKKNLDQIHFVCLVNYDKYKEIMTYNQIMDHIRLWITLSNRRKMPLYGGSSKLQDMKAPYKESSNVERIHLQCPC